MKFERIGSYQYSLLRFVGLTTGEAAGDTFCDADLGIMAGTGWLSFRRWERRYRALSYAADTAVRRRAMARVSRLGETRV